MNDRFQSANTRWDSELLWTLILNDLLTRGYYFTIFDLMHYWEFQYGIYKSILNGLTSSGDQYSNWPYFSDMFNVFEGSSSTNVVSVRWYTLIIHFIIECLGRKYIII